MLGSVVRGFYKSVDIGVDIIQLFGTALWRTAKMLARAVTKVVVKIAKFSFKALISMVKTGYRTARGESLWEAMLLKNVKWRQALRSREDADKAINDLVDKLDDLDNNGIPDLYDAEVVTPEQDFLGLKFPQRLFLENDYVRYLPRGRGVVDAQPVGPGGKGLVRSTALSNVGAHAWVKWNVLSRGEGRPSPLFRVNQMDLHHLGHVYSTHRVTY